MSVTVSQPVTKPVPVSWFAARLAAARKRGDRGASALEFLGFSVVALLLIVIVAVAITAAVQTKADNTSTCITTSDTTAAGGCK